MNFTISWYVYTWVIYRGCCIMSAVYRDNYCLAGKKCGDWCSNDVNSIVLLNGILGSCIPFLCPCNDCHSFHCDDFVLRCFKSKTKPKNLGNAELRWEVVFFDAFVLLFIFWSSKRQVFPILSFVTVTIFWWILIKF